MNVAVLVAALAAAAPIVKTELPPAPLHLYSVAWSRSFVPPRVLEWKPREFGGVAVDPVSGLAVFGTRDGWLHAVRPDGTVAWEFRTSGPFAGQPAIEGDAVYAGSSDGRLYAVGLADGKERWRYDAKEELGTRPVVENGTVFVASLQDTVFAVDARSGAWKWHHRREPRPGFSIRGAAPVAFAGDSVYAAYSDGFVVALDPANGRARWERLVAPAGDQVDVDGLAVDGDQLYVAAYSGAVLALDGKTGATRWTFEAAGATRVMIAPGGIVVAVGTGGVFALSSADGGAVWSSPLIGVPVAEPVLAGKWLLVPAGDGGLRWIEAASGRVLRVFDPGTGVSSSPAVLAGRVYVLSNRGGLFALDLS